METIIISGRIAIEAEIFKTEKSNFISFSVAVDQGKKENGDEKDAKFFKVIKFFKEVPSEEIKKVFSKGNIVTVQGTVTSSGYIDKQGNAAASLEIKAEKADLLHYHKVQATESTEA